MNNIGLDQIVRPSDPFTEPQLWAWKLEHGLLNIADLFIMYSRALEIQEAKHKKLLLL